jgi:hypothetical protein
MRVLMFLLLFSSFNYGWALTRDSQIEVKILDWWSLGWVAQGAYGLIAVLNFLAFCLLVRREELAVKTIYFLSALMVLYTLCITVIWLRNFDDASAIAIKFMQDRAIARGKILQPGAVEVATSMSLLCMTRALVIAKDLLVAYLASRERVALAEKA